MAFRSERYLSEAIEQCKLYKIVHLIKQGYNIHKQNSLGQNFLVYLLQQQQQQDLLLSKKRFQIFQYLIANYNLNIHLFDYYGKNVFNWATNLNCAEEALYLLNSYPGDIDILVRDQSGSCSLHYAVEYGNEILVQSIVNYLLRYRLRFDIKDSHNNTPEDVARKLGYEKIAHFLAQASRSTVFMSREIPFYPQRPMTNKTKTIINATSSTISVSSSLLDSSEYFNSLETRINTAKSLDDWKTVATLRSFKRNINDKNSNKIRDSIPAINRRTSFGPFPSTLPYTNITSKSSGQAEQMLRLIEPQMTSSFRRSFIPTYQQSINPTASFQRSSNIQRKMSQTSSRRMSSVLSVRKRDSEASQMSLATLQDVQSRFSVPPIYKQYRQSAVTTN